VNRPAKEEEPCTKKTVPDQGSKKRLSSDHQVLFVLVSVLSGTFFAFVFVDFSFANFSSTSHE
jgi:hypothetical protein